MRAPSTPLSTLNPLDPRFPKRPRVSQLSFPRQHGCIVPDTSETTIPLIFVTVIRYKKTRRNCDLAHRGYSVLSRYSITQPLSIAGYFQLLNWSRPFSIKPRRGVLGKEGRKGIRRRESLWYIRGGGRALARPRRRPSSLSFIYSFFPQVFFPGPGESSQ